jgi:hypothetical protein
MLDFIQSQLLFYLAIILVFFVPGYSLLFAIFGKKWPFSKAEAFFISFGAGLISTTFIILLIGRLAIPITGFSVVISIILFALICGGIFFLRQHKKILSTEKMLVFPEFSKMQFIALILLLVLTFFIKTIYLKDAILPSTTDLGHHMYWAKTVTITEKIPVYAKNNIDMETDSITAPSPIADFIIGEHLIFSAVNFISKIDFISYFPVLILLLIHMMGILTLFFLTRLIFKEYPQANTIAIATLFFIGPLYALASPQTKFVSGGVIGNIIGNFFIPLTIYFFLRALTEKSSTMLAFALFISLGMVYTHHLSTFVFIFIFFFSALFFILFNFREIKIHLNSWLKICLKPAPIGIMLLGIFFVFFIYTPTYLNTKAIGTAVGTPSKSTRIGVTLTELSNATTGKIRMAFSLFGLIMLIASRKRKKYYNIFIIGWTVTMLMISIEPGLFYINIPSNRISDYIIFPFSILSGFSFVYLFESLKDSKNKKQLLKPSFVLIAFLLLFTFSSMNGLHQNSSTLNTNKNIMSVLETYHVSNFLAQKTTANDIILKDHNYIAADSWIKLYFMHGYAYPLSRGYFKRYDDTTKNREQCTNLMISVPNAVETKKCFTGTKTNFLIVNPKFDSAQFLKSKNFWQVYASNDIAVFYKNN